MTKMRDFANGHATLTLVPNEDSPNGDISNAYAFEQWERSALGQYILNLGSGFGKVYESATIHLRHRTGDGQALMTIAHEICHLVFSANVPPQCPAKYKDEKYREEALKLAADDPEGAAWNAENYAYFIEACSPDAVHAQLKSEPEPEAETEAKQKAEQKAERRVQPHAAKASNPSETSTEEGALHGYLEHIGLGEYAAAFRENGVTSLKLLRMLDSDAGKDTRKDICTMIRDGWTEGDKHLPGSKLAANQLETVTADDVQAWLDKEQTSDVTANQPEAEPKAAKAKKEQLRQAVEQVKELREQWAKVADKSNEAEKAKVAGLLDKILGPFRAENVLQTLPTAEALAKDLNAYFITTETALAHVSALTTAAVRKTELSAVDLIFGHQLLRGRYVDANGTTEAPGGSVLAMPRRSSNADLFGPGLETQDFSRSFQSESAMMRSEHLVETHASSTSVATEASGAAFMGTGIGAMSISAQYAHAKEERDASSSASNTRSALQLQTRYHWLPMRQIVFATNEFRLNSEALAAVRAMLGKDTRDRRDDVLNFMRSLGTHVFGRITLGGWYKYTARATAKDVDDRGDVEAAMAEAMDWAVSASATYVGLGSAVSMAAASKGEDTKARVSGREFRGTFSSHEVSISTSMLGGIDGLPREEWIGSLQFPAQWRVIQREAPVPIWELVRKIEPARLGTTAGDITTEKLLQLAKEFEEVWVQEIFARSVDDAVYKGVTETKPITSATALEAYLKGLLVPVARPQWDPPEDDARAAIMSPSVCTYPSAFLYRNALYVSALARSVSGAKYLDLRSFDGQHWMSRTSSSCGLIEPGAPKKNTPFQLDQLYKAHLSWIAVEPALAVLEGDMKGYLIACVPHKEKQCLYFFALVPPDLHWLPQEATVASAAPVGPALIRFAGKLRVLYVDTNGKVMCGVVPEDHSGDVLTPVPTKAGTPLHNSEHCKTDHRIAAAVFDNRLYCAYRETGNDTKLWCTNTADGDIWTEPAALPGKDANNAPSLAVFVGPEGRRLYCAYAGHGGDEPLYVVSTADGVTWDTPTQVGNVHTGGAPSLVAFADQHKSKLYCFYQTKDREEDSPISYRVMASG